MFGFLRPEGRTPVYQRAYCRCCQHQRRNFGIVSLPILTYESAFAYLMALDAIHADAAIFENEGRCTLRMRPGQPNSIDEEIGRFAASFGILLRSVKFDDDIRDRRSVTARIFRWLISKKSNSAMEYFSSLDARFSETLHALIDDHHKMEESRDCVSIARFSEPTARAYGYVLGLLGQLPGLSDYRTTFRSVGEKVGAATVAFDAAADWKKDKRSGHFNPVQNDAQALSAVAFSESCLRDAPDLC